MTPLQVDYSLEVYSMASFALKKLPFTMRHVERTTGGWKGATAGGCSNHDTCVDNPRYALELQQPTDLQIELESGDSSFAVGLQLHAEASKTPFSATGAIATSGNYRKGFCLVEARAVPPGRYTLNPSTFTPRQVGAFTLSVGSSAPITLRMVAPEGHGLARQVVNGEWSLSAGSAAGSPNHGQYHRNPHVRLSLQQPAEVVLRLRCPSRVTNRPSGLGLTLYRCSDRLPAEWRSIPKSAVAHDGVYAYPVGGIVVPRTQLAAGSYVCVLSTYDPFNGPFELIVHAPEGAARLAML